MTKQFLTGNQAFAHAALEAGVRVCAGYPGTPSSEVIETVAAEHAAGRAEGVHVEWSTNEKAALELLAGAAYAGARTLFTCKQVGLNVASDALMSLNYVGVKGGTVLYVADDPGPISSQTEQDTRRFASFAKVPVFDPATPEQGCAMMACAYDLSERYHTPVIMRPTTRICHASTFVEVADSAQARIAEGFERDPRWVIFPKRSFEAHGEINERLPKIAHDFSTVLAQFNPIDEVHSGAADGRNAASAADAKGKTGTASGPAARNTEAGNTGSVEFGIVAGGVSYAYMREAMRMLEDEVSAGEVVDAQGNQVEALPAYRMVQVGTPYPFPEERMTTFVQGLQHVMVFEELDNVLEDEMLKLAGKLHANYTVYGKLSGHTTKRGENTVDAVLEQLRTLFGVTVKHVEKASALELDEPPARPPLLCPGCSHRGAFYAVKEALRRRKDGIFCGDIGCYTLGNAKPLDAVDTCLCMGAGITVAQGMSIVEPDKKALAFIGDSTFFASGMTGVANAVYNQHDITIVVLDNATTAMTGSQPHPGTGVTLMGPKSEPISIDATLRALGVKCIKHADPLRLDEAISAAKEAIDFDGPSAVIYESPCIKLIKPSKPVAVDLAACTGCGRCVLKLGCPALSWNAETKHPVVDESLCNGCGLCVDVCNDGALMCDSRAKYSRPCGAAQDAAQGAAQGAASNGASDEATAHNAKKDSTQGSVSQAAYKPEGGRQ